MSSDQDKPSERKTSSKWLGGPPSASKNPFRREKSDLTGTSIKKSMSASAVGRSLRKSVSSSSLGKSIKRAASKLSLSSRDTKSFSVKNISQQNDMMPERSRSSNSVGTMDIGETVRTRFIWDHGGTIVYVCVMQNGIKKSYRLLKENEGYHAANATLWAGRCEFR